MSAVKPISVTGQNLGFIHSVNHSINNVSMDALIMHRWGELGEKGRGLRFSPSGLVRIGQIFGFIEGLAISNQPCANFLADCISEKLDYLNQYGGFVDEPRNGRQWVPKYITVLYDHGAWNSFSLASYIAVDRDQFREDNNLVWEHGETAIIAAAAKHNLLRLDRALMPHSEPALSLPPEKSWYYKYDWNGGLNYHHSENLNNKINPWSVNT